MRNLTHDDLEELLSEHRYSSADDMVDESCSCGEWPTKWTRGGYPRPIPGWIAHVLQAAEDQFPDAEPDAAELRRLSEMGLLR